MSNTTVVYGDNTDTMCCHLSNYIPRVAAVILAQHEGMKAPHCRRFLKASNTSRRSTVAITLFCIYADINVG